MLAFILGNVHIQLLNNTQYKMCFYMKRRKCALNLENLRSDKILVRKVNMISIPFQRNVPSFTLFEKKVLGVLGR